MLINIWSKSCIKVIVVVVITQIIKNKMVGAGACVRVFNRINTLFIFTQYDTSKNI
jgi:hypothetical protein